MKERGGDAPQLTKSKTPDKSVYSDKLNQLREKKRDVGYFTDEEFAQYLKLLFCQERCGDYKTTRGLERAAKRVVERAQRMSNVVTKMLSVL